MKQTHGSQETVSNPDRYQKWISCIKSNPIIAFLIVLATVVSAIAKFGESLATIPVTLGKLWPGQVATIATGVYVQEIANEASTSPPVLFQEVRELSTGCRIYRDALGGNETGLWASPGAKGARATILLKFLVTNASKEKLSNIRLFLSPARWPFEFTSMGSTPNVTAQMSRVQPAQGGASTYLVNIDKLAPDDFAVVTLSAPLKKENVTPVFSRPLEMTVLSFRADQFDSKALKIDRAKLSAKELYFVEGVKTTGKPSFSFDYELEILHKDKPLLSEYITFLPPAKECNK